MISISADGVDPGAGFIPIMADVEIAVARAVNNTGVWLQTQVRTNANTGTHAPGLPHIPGTGPGPNVATEDYVRSIGLKITRSGGAHVATVSTNLPQARRLELGFIGVDSLGRAYRQSPYPHWRPAIFLVNAVLDRELSKAFAATRRTA